MIDLSIADIVLSVVGGILISVSTSFHFFMKGRVTGFSGILYSLIHFEQDSLHWKAGLFCGLTATSAVLYKIFGFNCVWDNTSIFDAPLAMIGNLSIVGFGISGLLAGIGTKMSNGCTSGHGVCGLPRFSKRSWLSVALFLPFGVGIASLRYYQPFLQEAEGEDIINEFNYDNCANAVLAITLFIALILLVIYHRSQQKSEVLIGFFTGVIFSLGLGFGGMFKRTKINGFLTINSEWDPSLLFLLGSAVGINMITFNYMIHKKKKPLMEKHLNLPQNSAIDIRLIIGSILFGIAWGLGGLCPGPAMGLISIFSIQISIVWLVLFGIGQQIVT